MKFLFTTFVYFIFASYLHAQSEDFKPINRTDFQQASYGLDSTAEAIYLDELGKSRIEISNRESGLRVYHTYKARIKILKQNGYKHANFTIPLYKYGNDFEYIEGITASTYNLENNNIITSIVDKKSIITENKSEYLRLVKFTLPNIKIGSILEIEYTVVSPDIFNYRSWSFQSDIPKLNSVYNVTIPAITKYNVTLKGPLKLTDTKSRVISGCFSAMGVKSDCSNIAYMMKNIPAFKEEAYMLAPKNYKSAVNFELEEMTNPSGGTIKYTKTWTNVDRELMTDKSFGGQIKKQDFFKELFANKEIKKESNYATANNIYKWITSQIKWNNYYGKYSQNGVEDAIKKRSGNAADINLALVAALNAMEIEAYPVIISTRENGLPHNLHPVISEFNYVIAAIKIDDEIILADATDPLLQFGELPLRCINDRGRIIYSKKSSEWIPLLNKIISTTHYTYTGSLDQNGKSTGELSIANNGLSAFNKRKEILEYPTTEEYIEKLDERLTHISIKNGEILNLDEPNQLLIENHSIDVTIGSPNNNMLYLSPIFINRVTQNPFNLDERNYAVDLGAKKDENWEITLDLPDGYTLESAPKNLSMALPESSARYVFKSKIKDNKLIINQYISLKKAIYSSEEYFGLKEFFSRIIQHLKVDFVFKKQS